MNFKIKKKVPLNFVSKFILNLKLILFKKKNLRQNYNEFETK